MIGPRGLGRGIPLDIGSIAKVFAVARFREINLHPDMDSALRSTAGRPHSI
jgi:hypothetical protein